MNKIRNHLTIDIEDYFQVSAFESTVGYENWDRFESRLEQNTRRILEILKNHEVSATFFVLGWVAEKFPAIVRQIADLGHDIGCHSYYHRLVYDLTPKQFEADTRRAKNLLEEVSGRQVLAYRAPSYSITQKSAWALGILEKLGFKIDSSIFPIFHDIYGWPGFARFPQKLPGLDLMEYPLSTVRIAGRNIPVAGGGYFRLFPYVVTKNLLKRINRKERQPFIFYIHPWELDPGQPKMRGIKKLSRFRHYQNLSRTQTRLSRLLSDFRFGPLSVDRVEEKRAV